LVFHETLLFDRFPQPQLYFLRNEIFFDDHHFHCSEQIKYSLFPSSSLWRTKKWTWHNIDARMFFTWQKNQPTIIYQQKQFRKNNWVQNYVLDSPDFDCLYYVFAISKKQYEIKKWGSMPFLVFKRKLIATLFHAILILNCELLQKEHLHFHCNVVINHCNVANQSNESSSGCAPCLLLFVDALYSYWGWRKLAYNIVLKEMHHCMA